MNFKEHKGNFNKRWDITPFDSDEVFSKFKQNILNIFQSIKVMGRL